MVDFRESNLHVVGYSVPVDTIISLGELQGASSLAREQPDAIPYVTSYYEERWGFCLSHKQKTRLTEGDYRVVIDSELRDGSLTYGELVHPRCRRSRKCSSRPTSAILRWPTTSCLGRLSRPGWQSGSLASLGDTRTASSSSRRPSARLLYLSRNLDHLKKNVVAGFNVTCVGDDRAFSYLPSRHGATLADRVALTVLNEEHPDFIRYPYLDRGSDERQYCSPGSGPSGGIGHAVQIRGVP